MHDTLPDVVAELLASGTARAVHVTTPGAADAITEGEWRAADGSRAGTVLWGSGVYVALDEPTAALWRGADTVDLEEDITLRNPYLHDYDAYGAASARVRDWDRIAAAVAEQLHAAAAQAGQDYCEALAVRAEQVRLPGEARRARHAAAQPATLRAALLGVVLRQCTYREAWAADEGVERDGDGCVVQTPWGRALPQGQVRQRKQIGHTAMLREAGHDGLIVVERTPTLHAGGNQACAFDVDEVSVLPRA